MKTKPLYSLTERAIKDMKKSPTWGWMAILAIYIIITAMIAMAQPSKASLASDTAQRLKVDALLKEGITEDYSADLQRREPLEFGKLLSADLAVELIGDYTPEQRKWVQFAWQISHDKEFLYMLKAENGNFTPDRKSENPGEDSWGFCQINRKYHRDIVNDPRFFSDPSWQMQKCYDLFVGGTVFYGHKRVQKDWKFRNIVQSHFNFAI